jgi:hypothetical protein
MPTAPLLRRPVFIYGNNVVGGAEYMFLRRAEAARRLGLEPVIITPPGAMDAKYRAVARVLHAPRPLLAKAGAWPGLNARLASQLAAQLGPGPWSFEATAMPGLHLASLLAERLPGSDYAFFVIGPQAAPRHRPPRLADLITRPGRWWRALRGRDYYEQVAELADRGRFFSVNEPCAEDVARQLGRPGFPVGLHPVVVLASASPPPPTSGRFLLSVSRLDGTMKAYVDGLIQALPALRVQAPDLTLTIVGDGPDRARLEALACRLAPGAVTFLGTLDNVALASLYAGCTAFVGMGTASIEAALHGAPVVFALESEPRALSPGYYGDPAVLGFGEKVPGQGQHPVADYLARLVQDAAFRQEIAQRGQAQAESRHGIAGLDQRLRVLLASPPSVGPVLPCPWPAWSRLLLNVLSGYAWRPLVKEVP